MLVRFSCTATESITMFGDVAVRLIKLLGASGAIPGAIRAEDVPAALHRLRQHAQPSTERRSEPAESATGGSDDENPEPPVALSARAAPLIGLLERAAAANVPLMWEAS